MNDQAQSLRQRMARRSAGQGATAALSVWVQPSLAALGILPALEEALTARTAMVRLTPAPGPTGEVVVCTADPPSLWQGYQALAPRGSWVRRGLILVATPEAPGGPRVGAALAQVARTFRGLDVVYLGTLSLEDGPRPQGWSQVEVRSVAWRLEQVWEEG